MRIIVVGDGKVGYNLAEQLAKEDHDVVVVDRNQHTLQKTQEMLDVMIVMGNGASMPVLQEAGIEECDLLIAVTSGDEVNILCCMMARKLGCRQTIARVRNPEYDEQLMMLNEDLGFAMTINPEKTAALEMYRLLQLPSFLKRDSFANGKAELVEIKVMEKGPLCGLRLEQLPTVIKTPMLICAVDRNGEVTIPSGKFKLMAGDKVTLTAATSDLIALIKKMGLHQQKIRDVILVGGSRTAVYLAKALIKSHVHVKLIEIDEARCEEIAEQLPEALVINGDGTLQDTLCEEGIENTDAVVTLTGIDEENIIISLFASKMGAKKTITKVNRSEYSFVFMDKDFDSMVVPQDIVADAIIRYVRGMNDSSGSSVITLSRIIGGKAEALEFLVTKGTNYAGTPLSKVPIKDGILMVCINRNGKIIIPKGSDTFEPGDTVIIVSDTGMAIKDMNEIFKKQAAEG